MATLVALQPTANKDARDHYVDTIEHPVPLTTIRDFVNDDVYQEIEAVADSAGLATWGVTPGGRNVNVGRWKRLSIGDIALFAREGSVHASATIVFTVHNEALAEQLWGRDSKKRTWEYMYFLDEVVERHIPYRDLNAVLGYAPNNVVQGFTVLDEDRSTRLIEHFELPSDRYLPDVPQEEYIQSVNALAGGGDLDIKRVANARTEQTYLRRALFCGRARGTCGICGLELPVGFLVAAHIKKRAECTREERIDVANIVMPMCKLGCDEIYERGYIGVREGRVVGLKSAPTTQTLSQYIAQVAGKTCRYWSDGSRKYFDYHLRCHGA